MAEFRGGANDIPTEILKDLTTNERRRLIGFKPILDKQNSEQLLAEKLGVGGTQALIEIVSNTGIEPGQKQELLMTLFDFTSEQVKKIIK